MNVNSVPNSANFGTATNATPVTIGQRFANRKDSGPIQATPQTADERTALLGRAIAARCQNDHPMLWMHTGTHPQSPPSITDRELAIERWFAELLCENRPSHVASPDSSLAWSSRLNRVLQWTLDHTCDWHPLVREACILKALMPYYMTSATSPGHAEAYAIAHAEVRELMPELITIVELNRCLAHAGFTEWLCEPQRVPYDPRVSIESAFRVSLPGVATSLWDKIRTTKHVTPLPKLHEHARASNREHKGWWSIAWQWSNPQAELTLPSGSPIGKVSWEQLKSHWKGLYALLCDSAKQEDTRLVEIRTAGDAILGNVLDQMLQDARVDQGLLSMVVARWLGDAALNQPAMDSLSWWQSEFIRCMSASIETPSPRGFVTESGDLALVYRDIERMELVQGVRDAFAETNRTMIATHHLTGNRPPPLIAGVAAVSAPSRSFQIEQIIDAAWRCLDGAKAQGPGSIKSIEVF